MNLISNSENLDFISNKGGKFSEFGLRVNQRILNKLMKCSRF